MPASSLAVCVALALSASAAVAQPVRDSAGIRIVDNARPLWTAREALHLAPAPSLVIGRQAGPEYKLGRIRGVYRLANGDYVVADGASRELRYYDANGSFIRAAAGKGTEPGQLRDMEQVIRMRGDTIAVGFGFADVALFTSTGDFAGRVASPPAPDRASPRGRKMVIAVLGDGSRAVVPIPSPAPRSPGTRWSDSIALQLIDRNHAVVKDLGPHAYVELEMAGREPTTPWLSAVGVFAGDDRHFYTGFGDRYAIRVYSIDGTLQRIVRRAWTPAPVSPAEWERWVVEWSKIWIKSTGEKAAKEIQELRESPYAETLPAFSQLLPDRVGRLWVRAAHLDDAIGAGSLSDLPAVPSKWSVFDPSGRWLGDVVMPVNFQPYDIGADYVAGKLIGDDDVATAVVFTLRPGTSRR